MTDLRLYRYAGYTLVDITNTGVIKYSEENNSLRNQQCNWESVIQILSLRTQIMSASQSKILSSDVSDFKFGESYSGTHNIWYFEFIVEYADVYGSFNDPFKVLINDFSKVPVNIGLNETVSFPIPMFYTKDLYKNIYFDNL